MTPIQLAAIPHALAGRDVLAAAPTGSGKTVIIFSNVSDKWWMNVARINRICYVYITPWISLWLSLMVSDMYCFNTLEPLDFFEIS